MISLVNIPIEFFQASATIIPALLIALAVGAKHGEDYAERMTEKRFSGFIAIVTVLVLVFVIGAGEVTALIGIIFGGASAGAAGLVFTAILLCILLVARELTQPLFAKTSRRVQELVLTCLGVGFLAGLGAFVIATW